MKVYHMNGAGNDFMVMDGRGLSPDYEALAKKLCAMTRADGFMAVDHSGIADFKLEFGRLSDGTIVLADEISPDTCRLWDSKTHEKLDKDRFRRDLGGVEEAYAEIMRRLEEHL